MFGQETRRDADFESASSRLNEGLKNCREMVANYRAMLRGERDGGSRSSEASDGDISRYISTTSNTDASYTSGSESA